MKRFTTTIIALGFAMSMPMIASAMSHEEPATDSKPMAGEMMQHEGMGNADQGMHDMGNKADDFVEIGKDTQDGVVATVKVKTYDAEALATMAKMGMNATHHVMVFFTDETSGEAITSGKVALKTAGEEAKPVMMMQMGTGFGGDVTLGEGMHTLDLGTKLSDGTKRQFSIMFHNM